MTVSHIGIADRTSTKKRRPRVAHSQVEAFALPYRTNKQQETYADMTYTDYPVESYTDNMEISA